MGIIIEGTRAMEFLANENGAKFAQGLTLIAGQNLRGGTVLGQISASGKYTQLAPAAADGSQNAAAILCFATDASTGDRVTTIIRGGPGVGLEVRGSLLVWPAGITAPQRTTAIAALAALGFKIR